MGRLELDFGGIGCEFGGSAHLLPLLLNGGTTFLNSGLVGLMFFSSQQQSSVEKCETVFKDLIEDLPL